MIIGRAEKADLVDFAITGVPVKIDTGADASSICASSAEVRDRKLYVVFFEKDSPFYDGIEHIFKADHFTITRVANSFGHREVRYKIKLRIRIKKRVINGTFTLSDRSTKLYPVLIGRSLLRNKFLVDVSKGNPLKEAEKERSIQLKKELETLKGEL